jgi:TonB family protein
MTIALSLLLISLVSVLYHDRDFWFPDTQEAEELPGQNPVVQASSTPLHPRQTASHNKKPHAAKTQANATSGAPAAVDSTSDAPPNATITRTVLPPLEVEVVAGNSHRKLKPNPNSVQVQMESDSPEESANAAAAAGQEQTAANVTDNAAERVQMSPDTSEIVTQPVKPGYPMLAREMKVQGSVILLAMISREGSIQDLRVLSGPPILAGAAREAVKQWHFKPHFEGADTVETVAKVTVNFTISTN